MAAGTVLVSMPIPEWSPAAGAVLNAVGALLLGSNARDNNISSEDAGVK